MGADYKIKNIVNAIAVDYTRGDLEDMCRFYYDAYKRNIIKARRTELEQIAYIRMVLNIDPAGIYELVVNGKVYKAPVYAAGVVHYVLRKTIFNWYEEPEYPITRDTWQFKVTVRQVGVRSIY